jgi:hypothetical protein
MWHSNFEKKNTSIYCFFIPYVDFIFFFNSSPFIFSFINYLFLFFLTVALTTMRPALARPDAATSGQASHGKGRGEFLKGHERRSRGEAAHASLGRVRGSAD